MKRTSTYILFSGTAILLCLAIIYSCNKNKNSNKIDCSKINATYSADLKPLLVNNCNTAGCHNPGSINGDFTTYAGLKAKADNGTLNSRVVVQKNMPAAAPLSQDNINKFDCWIQSGSPNN